MSEYSGLKNKSWVQHSQMWGPKDYPSNNVSNINFKNKASFKKYEETQTHSQFTFFLQAQRRTNNLTTIIQMVIGPVIFL